MDHSRLLNNKTTLVTGGTSGIGFYTAVALARMGAAVYITGRYASRGQDAERQMRTSAGHKNIHFLQADAANRLSRKSSAYFNLFVWRAHHKPPTSKVNTLRAACGRKNFIQM